jgi:Arc/MetJ-type ribon-helix-helix transcriptional regulator
MRRQTLTIRLDPEIRSWIDKKLEEKRFGSYTHAIEEALLHLKKEMEQGKK